MNKQNELTLSLCDSDEYETYKRVQEIMNPAKKETPVVSFTTTKSTDAKPVSSDKGTFLIEIF